MTFAERVRLIKKLDDLIRRKYKGKSSEYAVKLEISSAALFRLLDYLKTSFDIPICYNKAHNCYEYCKDGIMYFGFLPANVLMEEQLKKLQGGSISYIADTYL